VTVDRGSGRLYGSVRVFDRRMLLAADGGPQPTGSFDAVPFAGIGEVCTDPDARGKGVASVMMPDAVAHCEERTGAVFSALHAAPAVSGLYARYGYKGDLSVPYGTLRSPL
jgi:predicted GNAT family N-acyltransferase